MSKVLKKVIDINGLRELKKKLVGPDSVYVQTGAVDQTVGGTKTFSKPIVGSVTGSSGSCTGNAASATKLQTARTINGTSFDGSANVTTANWGTARNITITDGTNTSTAVSVNGSTNVSLNLPATIKAAFVGNVTGNVTGNCSGSSGSCTGNAATATKAVSADSATNASHATSADKATKAEQDGNGNNIVASYVAAGSEDSTTDIGAFMAARPSFIKSFTYNNVWTDAISMRHRNGSRDGPNYGTYIRSANMTAETNLLWNHQFGGTWQGERTLIDSANLAGFTKSAITVYDLVPDGAEAHNAMWGGRDITAAFDAGTVSANISNGTFKDIFPGDYITKQITIPQVLADDGTTVLFAGGTYTVNWVIADCDYWINKGDTSVTTAHHVAIVPQAPIFNAQMNPTNSTEGGYAGSAMYKNVIPACATGIVNAFGGSHILTFRDLIVNNINASGISLGNSSWLGVSALGSGQWVDAQCNLIGEHMVYGHSVWSSGGENQMIQTRQFSAFRLSERLINYNRQWWWLRDVVSSALFANVSGGGYASAYDASSVYGVRPFALLI